LSHLKGEEAIIFLGISADGSPLLVHHLSNVGSTRKDPLPNSVALAGLRQATSVVRLPMEDCFVTIPSGTDGTDEEYYLPSFSKLVTASSAGGFAKVTPSQTKTILALECLCLLPLPPFLIPCIASHAHSGFAELGKACVKDIVACELTCDDGGLMKANSHCQRIAQFMWWATQPGIRTHEYRFGMTLLMDPKPSIVSGATQRSPKAIGTKRPTTTAESDGPVNLFS
jgi:hypothetical protein